MIPDYLIDAAMDEYAEASGQAVRRPWMRAALEAVAGDIFQHGYNLGQSDSLLDRIGIDAPNNPNPYRNERA